MKPDGANPQKLAALLRRVKSQHKVEDPLLSDPVAQLVIGFLQWQASRRRAQRAFAELLEKMVDINELRVSHPREIITVIGESYPFASDRVIRLRETLNEIYRREHAMALTSIGGRSKKEQRQYLETLPGIMPYVTSQVMLLAFGGHAFPVDEKLVTMLVGERVLAEPVSVAHVESFILRHVKASDSLQTHMAMQAWSDSRRSPTAPRSRKGSSVKRTSSRKKSNTKRTKKKK